MFKYSIIFFLLMLLGASCSIARTYERREIKNIIQTDSLYIDIDFDKICYLKSDRTFFALNRKNNNISIYKNSAFFNRVGGSGFEVDNFRKLTDISVGADGFIYALDSFEKSVKRIDKDGVVVSKINLPFLAQPERLAFTGFGALYIYDANRKEIYSLDSFDYSVKFNFGKFQINNADNFYISGNNLVTYNYDNHETVIFNINGQFVNTYSQYLIVDMFENMLTVKDNSLVDFRTGDVLLTVDGLIRYLDIANNKIFILSNKILRVYRIEYEKN